MQDLLGNTLQLGDTVLRITGTRYIRYQIGTITRFTPERAEVTNQYTTYTPYSSQTGWTQNKEKHLSLSSRIIKLNPANIPPKLSTKKHSISP